MTHPAWSGGHMTLARGALALYLAARLPGAGAMSPLVGALVAALALAFGLGWKSRASGLALAAAGLLLAGGSADAGLRAALLFAGLLALAPPDPWGSLDRRGAADPGSDWRMPAWIPAWMWIASGVLFLIDLGQGRWPLGWPHLLLISPAWIPPLAPGEIDRVFYDGRCGLCHGTVRFLIAEDTEGARFRYAPLDSEALRARLDPAARGALPDSVVVYTADDELRLRSDGVIRLAARLGGWWGGLAWLAGCVPRAARDAVYDLIARTRYRIFGTRDEACPLLPEDLRRRFDP